MKNWLENTNKTRAIVTLIVSLAVLMFSPQPSLADFSQEELDKQIEELIHKPQTVYEMDRVALEQLRDNLKNEGTTEQVKQLDLELDKKLLPFKSIDQCKVLRELVNWAKNRALSLNLDEMPLMLTSLFLLKANVFLRDQEIEDHLKNLELIKATTIKDGEAKCVLDPKILSGINGYYAKNANEFLTKAGNNALAISVPHHLYALQFALLFWSQYKDNKDFIESAGNNLARYLMVLPHYYVEGTIDKGSFLQTYAYVTSILAKPVASEFELGKTKTTIAPSNNLSFGYPLGREGESARASSGRAIPAYLALYTKTPKDSEDRALYRQNLLEALDFYVTPEVLPWLILHSESNVGDNTEAHVGGDRLGYHYFYPSLPYATAALQLLKSDANITEEDMNKIALIDDRLRNAIANIYHPDSFFDKDPYSYLEKNALGGLAMLPLMKEECFVPSPEKINSLGILRENIGEDKMEEKNPIDVILAIRSDPQIPPKMKYTTISEMLLDKSLWSSLLSQEEKDTLLQILIGLPDFEIEQMKNGSYDDALENRPGFIRGIESMIYKGHRSSSDKERLEKEFDAALVQKLIEKLKMAGFSTDKPPFNTSAFDLFNNFISEGWYGDFLSPEQQNMLEEVYYNDVLDEAIKMLKEHPTRPLVESVLYQMREDYEHLSYNQKNQLIENLKSIPEEIRRGNNNSVNPDWFWVSIDEFIFKKTGDKDLQKKLLTWHIKKIKEVYYYGVIGSNLDWHFRSLGKLVDIDALPLVIDIVNEFGSRDPLLPSKILNYIPENAGEVSFYFIEAFPELKWTPMMIYPFPKSRQKPRNLDAMEF